MAIQTNEPFLPLSGLSDFAPREVSIQRAVVGECFLSQATADPQWQLTRVVQYSRENSLLVLMRCLVRCFWMIAVWHLLALFAPAAEVLDADVVAVPHWMSTHSTDDVVFRHEFSADFSIQQATLKFAADFCQATVSINEAALLEVAPFCQMQTVDVTNSLQRGVNVIRRSKPCRVVARRTTEPLRHRYRPIR